MSPSVALELLMLAAHWAGAPPPPAPVPAATRVAAEGPREVLRVPLRRVAARQAAAVESRPVGLGAVDFSLGLGPRASLWVKLGQGGRRAARSLPELEKGTEEAFPAGTCRFLLEGDALRAVPLEPPGGPAAFLSLEELLRRWFAAGLRASFGPVEYGVFYEDGSALPASIALVRKDHRGQLWATYKAPAELGEVRWFLAADSTMFGMRLEGEELVFYSKPVPPVSEPAFPGPQSRIP